MHQAAQISFATPQCGGERDTKALEVLSLVFTGVPVDEKRLSLVDAISP
jgi:hypothetical protein